MDAATFANVATAVTSILALLLSTYVFYHQTQQAKITLGITVLRELEKDFFSSADMKRKRFVAARFLLNRHPGQDVPQEAYELLDFFDNLGLHLNKRVLDPEMTWTVFHFWFDKYWHLLAQDVDSLHEYTDGVLYLENCIRAHTILDEFGRKHRKIPPPPPPKCGSRQKKCASS